MPAHSVFHEQIERFNIRISVKMPCVGSMLPESWRFGAFAEIPCICGRIYHFQIRICYIFINFRGTAFMWLDYPHSKYFTNDRGSIEWVVIIKLEISGFRFAETLRICGKSTGIFRKSDV